MLKNGRERGGVDFVGPGKESSKPAFRVHNWLGLSSTGPADLQTHMALYVGRISRY